MVLNTCPLSTDVSGGGRTVMTKFVLILDTCVVAFTLDTCLGLFILVYRVFKITLPSYVLGL